MVHQRKLVILAAFVVALLVLWRFMAAQDFLTFEYLKTHHHALREYVAEHYWRAVVIFILLYVSTSLIVPGALALTVAGGALFGTLPTALFVDISATVGSIVAFYVTRYLLAAWVQERYRNELAQFNRELDQHGYSYLLTLRIIPVLPAFLVNYLAGMTKVPPGTFLWTTSLGVLPGAVIYAYAGSRLSRIESASDIVSLPMIAAFLLMGLFSLLPVILKYAKRLRK